MGKKRDPKVAEMIMLEAGWKPLEPYPGAGEKWKCKCTKCGNIDFPRLSNARRGTGCRACGHKRGGERNKLSEAKVLETMLKADLEPIDPYKNYGGKWKSKCLKCSQIVYPTFSNIAKGHSGCVYCAGQKAIKGENDIKSLNPGLAEEAYGWDPSLYKLASNKQLEWQCKHGHIWSATPRTRQRSGCPFCSGRIAIKGETDFATARPELVKYVDGWDPSQETVSSGKRKSWKCDLGHTWQAVISSIARGNRCPFCSNQKVLVGFNDLNTTHPNISKEAFGWDPKNVVSGTPKILQWKCPVGHIWKCAGENRIKNGQVGTECSYCSNRKLLSGFNDLKTLFPSIAEEAFGWDPSKFLAGTSSRKLWKCKQGHQWRTGISSRTGNHKTGCPSCSSYGFDPNIGGYLYFIQHHNWQMLQIGITNYPDDRLKQHKRLGWEIIEIRGPMDGHLTQQWETAILRMLKEKGADLSNSKIAGKFDGYSEAWSKSIFPVKSIKELMRLTEEFEEGK
jgi:hypothetical protein